MKKILYFTLITTVIFSYGQQQKVGINKEIPEYDLDIKGTMRIENVNDINDSAIPLAWNENTKQVIKVENSSLLPFHKVVYRIVLKDPRDDWANEVNLGIDADKYHVVMLQSYLTRSHINRDNPSEAAAFIKALARKGNARDDQFNVIGSHKDGRIVNDDNREQILGSEDYTTEKALKLGFPIPEAKVYEKDGSYHFYGDFRHTRPVGRYGYHWQIGKYGDQFAWNISLLIIDKKWMKLTGY